MRRQNFWSWKQEGGIKEKPSENHKAELVANTQVVPFSNSSKGSMVL